MRPSRDGLGQHHAGLDAVDLVTRLADVVLGAFGLRLEALALSLERRVELQPSILELLANGLLLVGLALLDFLVDALDLRSGGLVECGVSGLAGLVASADDDLAGRLEDDRLLGRAGAQRVELGLCLLLLLDQLAGAVRALLFEVALARGQLRVRARRFVGSGRRRS